MSTTTSEAPRTFGGAQPNAERGRYRRHRHAVPLALAAVIFCGYNAWAVPAALGDARAIRAFAPELAADDQPLSWLFRALTALVGLAVLTVAVLLPYTRRSADALGLSIRARRWVPFVFIGLTGFGFATLLSAIANLDCARSIDLECTLLERYGVASISHTLNTLLFGMSIAFAAFAMLATFLLAAAWRTQPPADEGGVRGAPRAARRLGSMSALSLVVLLGALVLVLANAAGVWGLSGLVQVPLVVAIALHLAIVALFLTVTPQAERALIARRQAGRVRFRWRGVTSPETTSLPVLVVDDVEGLSAGGPRATGPAGPAPGGRPDAAERP